MAGGRVRCSRWLVAHGAVLLLHVFLPDMSVASSCQRIFHKKVGETVELPSCSPAEGVTSAKWKYNEKTVADKDSSKITNPHFQDRVSLNPTNFSLTLRKLTLQDSGDFSFIYEAKDQQGPTVVITLHVHEPISKEPVLTVNTTWDASNASCPLSLECRSTTDSRVNYSWTVRNETLSGSRLQHKIRPEDGKTTFTCTISNFISEKSVSQTVECSNTTSAPQAPTSSSSVLWIVGLISCIVVIVLLPLLVLCWCRKSEDPCWNRFIQSERINQIFAKDQAVSQDENQQQVYSSLLHRDLCVYETVRNRENSENRNLHDER